MGYTCKLRYSEYNKEFENKISEQQNREHQVPEATS